MYLVHCTIGSSCTSSWLNLRAPGFARGGRERWTVEHGRDGRTQKNTGEETVEHSTTHWSERTRVEHRQLLLLKLSGDGDGLMTVLTYQLNSCGVSKMKMDVKVQNFQFTGFFRLDLTY